MNDTFSSLFLSLQYDHSPQKFIAPNQSTGIEQAINTNINGRTQLIRKIDIIKQTSSKDDFEIHGHLRIVINNLAHISDAISLSGISMYLTSIPCIFRRATLSLR